MFETRINNTIKLLPIILVLTIFIACEKGNDFDDPDYPTTIKELSQQEITAIVNRVEQTPLWGCVAIDYYGSPIMTINDECIDSEWRMDFTEKELEHFAKEEFYKYRNFLNIQSPENVNILSITTLNNIRFQQFTTQHPDSMPTAWKITTTQQNFNGYEVLGTTLRMILSPNGAISISGQWYNNIYIPQTSGYSEDEMRENLMGSTFTHGRNTLIVTEETSWHASKIVILPIKRSGEIELHVCRAMYPQGWEILIDNYTGEELSSIKVN